MIISILYGFNIIMIPIVILYPYCYNIDMIRIHIVTIILIRYGFDIVTIWMAMSYPYRYDMDSILNLHPYYIDIDLISNPYCIDIDKILIVSVKLISE